MDVIYTIDNFFDSLKSIYYDVTIEKNETYFTVSFKITKNQSDYFISTISIDKLNEILINISKLNIETETIIFNENSFESIIIEERNLLKPSLIGYKGTKINIEDPENKISYNLDMINNEYLVWLLMSTKETTLFQKRLPLDFYKRRVQNSLEGNYDLLDLLSIIINLFSLKIKATNPTTLQKLITYSNSFVFTLAFNFDSTFIIIKSFEELLNKSRMKNVRKNSLEDLVAPKRIYNEILTRHYLLAISNESPNIQFLSYYHIMEHFFGDVFNDELVNEIKNKISSPSFSYKRKSDINELIKQVKNKLQIRANTTTINETEALKLVIKKFIDFENLKNELNIYDENLIEYYKTNSVNFCNGATFDLDQLENLDRLTKDISNRIYSTRCALVHSKDGSKEKYTPFKDERVLIKEVPLMRFIAEMIILSDSKEL